MIYIVLRSGACPAITNDQIRALREEAAQFGDEEMVEYCDAALSGDESAREACQDAIDRARAMED